MKIDDFLKEEMNWTDRDLEYRPVIGYWKVAELLQKWGEKQLLLHGVVKSFYCYDKTVANAEEDYDFKQCKQQCEKCKQ